MVGIDCNRTLGFTPRLLAQPCGQVRGAEVGVALEHLQRLMAGDGGDLHHVQSFLEESARSFVPQVMEAEPCDTGAAHGALERLLESFSCELTEDAAVRGRRQGAKNRNGAARERYAT